MNAFIALALSTLISLMACTPAYVNPAHTPQGTASDEYISINIPADLAFSRIVHQLTEHNAEILYSFENQRYLSFRIKLLHPSDHIDCGPITQSLSMFATVDVYVIPYRKTESRAIPAVSFSVYRPYHITDSLGRILDTRYEKISFSSGNSASFNDGAACRSTGRFELNTSTALLAMALTEN
jgi:hypothetical protein